MSPLLYYRELETKFFTFLPGVNLTLFLAGMGTGVSGAFRFLLTFFSRRTISKTPKSLKSNFSGDFVDDLFFGNGLH